MILVFWEKRYIPGYGEMCIFFEDGTFRVYSGFDIDHYDDPEPCYTGSVESCRAFLDECANRY